MMFCLSRWCIDDHIGITLYKNETKQNKHHTDHSDKSPPKQITVVLSLPGEKKKHVFDKMF